MKKGKTKIEPDKYCAYCGIKLERKRMGNGKWQSMFDFLRMKYCSMDCMKKSFSEKKSEPKTIRNGRSHAQKLIEIGNCAICLSKNGMDVHHIDKNPLNNSLENLQRVCRSCHNKIHHPKGKCTICGKQQKGYGYCEKHYQRFKKYGNPYIVKQNQFSNQVELDD